MEGFEFKFSLAFSAKDSYQAVSKELPHGSDWAGQKCWGSCASCLRQNSKSTRQGRSEKKYYLQFTSGNGFYLHFSRWFVAHWGVDLLKLSLVSPETGDPWSLTVAHGVGRQARKHSCRKVLPRLGRLDAGVKQRTAMPGFLRTIVIFLSILPLEQTCLFYITLLELPQALGKKHYCPCFCFLCSLWGMGEMWIFFCKEQAKKQKGEKKHRPGYSWDQWAKLMSCSKCENFCVESMPRAVYDLLNVSFHTERIYGAGKPLYFYPR